MTGAQPSTTTSAAGRVVHTPYGYGVAAESLQWLPTTDTPLELSSRDLGRWLFTPTGEGGLFGPITTIATTHIIIKTFPAGTPRRYRRDFLNSLRPLIIASIIIPPEAKPPVDGAYYQSRRGDLFKYSKVDGWTLHDGTPAVLPLIPQLIRRG